VWDSVGTPSVAVCRYTPSQTQHTSHKPGEASKRLLYVWLYIGLSITN